eukprot:GHVQ01002570.1.p2 GENE.GHVQ01002570.1~~GHVQ01002570.1.p2  ORF type:complete len:121 (+),score=14.94 GHVQ01002570.1:445-807(+)
MGCSSSKSQNRPSGRLSEQLKSYKTSATKSSTQKERKSRGGEGSFGRDEGRKSGGSKSVSKEILSKKIQQATQTRVLALRECGIKEIPQTAFQVSSVTTCDAACNKIKVIPDRYSIRRNV